MSDELQKIPSLELEAHARQIMSATKSEATKAAYRGDLRRFYEWAEQNSAEIEPATETTVAAYVVYLSALGRKPTTIHRALSAINQYHVLKGWKKPAGARVKEINKGIRRLKGVKLRKARPITWAVLDRMLKVVPGSAIGIRDKALLLLGFATAFRRSELVSINVEHIKFVDEGLIIEQTKSKTNQEGELIKTPVPFVDIKDRCPVRAVSRLIKYNRKKDGPIFYGLGSSGRRLLDIKHKKRLLVFSVNKIIKRYAKAAGYDPTLFSAHSLRAGFVTSASEAGLPSTAIMLHTGHKSYQVMVGYVREGRQFHNHPLSAIVSFSASKSTDRQKPTEEAPQENPCE